MIAGLYLGLDFGIIIGVFVNILFILSSTARPKLESEIVDTDDGEVLLITPDQSIFFSAADYMRVRTLKLAKKAGSKVSVVLIDGSQIKHIDATAGISFQTLSDDLTYLDKKLYFWNWNRQPMGVIIRTIPQFKDLFLVGGSVENDFRGV